MIVFIIDYSFCGKNKQTNKKKKRCSQALNVPSFVRNSRVSVYKDIKQKSSKLKNIQEAATRETFLLYRCKQWIDYQNVVQSINHLIILANNHNLYYLFVQ